MLAQSLALGGHRWHYLFVPDIRLWFVLFALRDQGLDTPELTRAAYVAIDLFERVGECPRFYAARSRFVRMLPPGFVLWV